MGRGYVAPIRRVADAAAERVGHCDGQPGSDRRLRLSTALQTRLIATVVAVVALIASCGTAPSGSISVSPTEPPLGPPDVLPPPGLAWTSAAGEVPTSVLSLSSLTCFDPQIALLTMGWPLGRPVTSEADGRQYIRDPQNAHRDVSLVPFEADAMLPVDAIATGYRYKDMELFTSAATAATRIYVRRGTVVEQWPRLREFVACL